MKVLVIGSGLVGCEVGRAVRDAGHRVTGTTTTASKAPSLAGRFDEVAVLRGSDRGAVAAASAGADAVVVTAGPAAQRAMSAEDRAETYRDALVETTASVLEATPAGALLVMLSSFSVVGRAADHLGAVDESAPRTTSEDPSPQCFGEAERLHLASGRSCVFRCSDIYGPADLPLADKIRMAHEVLGGSVPFSADARFYRVHVGDVAAAVVTALAQRWSGLFHLTHREVPPRNAELFDAIGASMGFGPLTYRGEIEAPTVRISVDKLLATGFRLRHTTPAVLCA